MSHRTVTIEARITVTLPEGQPEADYLRAGMHQMLDSVPHMSATNPLKMAAWPAGREVMVAYEANYSESVPFERVDGFIDLLTTSPLQPVLGSEQGMLL